MAQHCRNKVPLVCAGAINQNHCGSGLFEAHPSDYADYGTRGGSRQSAFHRSDLCGRGRSRCVSSDRAQPAHCRLRSLHIFLRRARRSAGSHGTSGAVSSGHHVARDQRRRSVPPDPPARAPGQDSDHLPIRESPGTGPASGLRRWRRRLHHQAVQSARVDCTRAQRAARGNRRCRITRSFGWESWKSILRP